MFGKVRELKNSMQIDRRMRNIRGYALHYIKWCDDLTRMTPRSKQSKQQFDHNLEILMSHYCDKASAHGVEFREWYFLKSNVCKGFHC